VAARLGSSADGTKEVKTAAFFSTLDFGLVMTKSYQPKFVPPTMRSDMDVRNFDVEFTRERAVDSVVVSHMSETLQAKTNFEGFTYAGGEGKEGPAMTEEEEE